MKKGQKHSDEALAKMRQAKLGKKLSRETREKIAQAGTGRKLSQEAIKKRTQARAGWKMPPEAIEKTRLSNLGRKISPEHFAKIMRANLGRKNKPESIKKMSDAKIGTQFPPEGLNGKGVNNIRAISGYLRSPKNITYKFINLAHFVRTNPHLFNKEDVAWRTDHKRVRRCVAHNGLLKLSGKNARGSWKGWTLVSDYERGANDGVDLLGRDELSPEATLAEISTVKSPTTRTAFQILAAARAAKQAAAAIAPADAEISTEGRDDQ